MQVQAAEGTVVFISFEGYNLGHGFYIKPTAVNVPSGSTVMDATRALLGQEGYEYALAAWGGLERVYGIHPGGTVTPPEYITIELESGPDDGSVGLFDYTEYSGWTFTINHFLAPVGADGLIVFNGDVIRWQFTIEGWGADIGLNPDWGAFAPGLFEHADKSELVRALFAEEANQDAIQNALETIINPLATPENVTDAFAALELPVEAADKVNLAEAIKEANTRQREDYIPEDAEWDPPFWGVLQTSIMAGQVVYDNPYATQLAVDGAAERLWVAIDNLISLESAEDTHDPSEDESTEDSYEPSEDESAEDTHESTEETLVPAETWVNPFVDVSQSDWFYEYVRDAYAIGLLTGVSTDRFEPNMNLSRAMAATLLWRLEGYPNAPDVTVFDDLQPVRWYSSGAAWAGANNIISAYTGDSFAPNQSVTMEQLAVILSNYAQYIGFDYDDAIAQIFAAFNPGDVVTRVEMVAIIQRLLKS